MLETSNYGLKKPEGTDTVSIDDLNYNADIIDTELKKRAELVDGKVPAAQLPEMNYLSPSGDGKDLTATFTEASTRANIATGEKLSVLFGKIKKYFTDLKAVAFTGNYTDLSNKPTSLPADGGTSSACSGNAATATKLQTARQINGVSFDGTQPITIADNTKAPTNHASPNSTYGLGEQAYYGHVALQANLTQATFQNGLALSGHLGKVLDDKINLMNPSLLYTSGTLAQGASKAEILRFDITKGYIYLQIKNNTNGGFLLNIDKETNRMFGINIWDGSDNVSYGSHILTSSDLELDSPASSSLGIYIKRGGNDVIISLSPSTYGGSYEIIVN